MSKKAIIWSVVGLSVVALALVVYGVLTHEEPGFVNPQMSWDKAKLPLKVSATDYSAEQSGVLGDDSRKTLEHVIESINTRLGFSAYVMAAEGDLADVTMEVGVPYENGAWEGAGGHYELAGHADSKRWHKCKVITSNTGTLDILSMTMKHELCHCLGLAHDDFDSSIMRPVQKPWEGGFPPRITDSDRALLRERYAP